MHALIAAPGPPSTSFLLEVHHASNLLFLLRVLLLLGACAGSTEEAIPTEEVMPTDEVMPMDEAMPTDEAGTDER